jgi:hypothetical protein
MLLGEEPLAGVDAGIAILVGDRAHELGASIRRWVGALRRTLVG